MGKHRYIRIDRPGATSPAYMAVSPFEDDPFTAEQAEVLDTGAALITPEGRFTDLHAYYEASEAERNARALDLVS